MPRRILWGRAGPRLHGATQLIAGGKVPHVSWRRRAPPTFAARPWKVLSGGGRESARTPAAKTTGAPSTIAPPPKWHRPAVREGTSLKRQRPAQPGAVGAVSNGASMAASSGGHGDAGVFDAGVTGNYLFSPLLVTPAGLFQRLAFRLGQAGLALAGDFLQDPVDLPADVFLAWRRFMHAQLGTALEHAP